MYWGCEKTLVGRSACDFLARRWSYRSDGVRVAHTPGRLTLGDHPPTAGQPSPTPPSSELADACGEGSFARTAVEWAIQPGSQAGFRAHENFLQWQFPHEAVARSNAVAGFLLGSADRRNLRSACVAVDLRSLKSVDKLPPPLPPASDRDQLFQATSSAGRSWRCCAR